MTLVKSARKFEPGTSGWTIDDLADPDIGARWSEGRYELVEGVLTSMAPQGFEGVSPQTALRRQIERHLDATAQSGSFYSEPDLLLRPRRVPRPDMVFLTAEQLHQQKQMERARGVVRGAYRPLFVMPLLVVESVSHGSEDHDRITKVEWYAEAKIPFYWLLTGYERSLVCLRLVGTNYVEEVAGRNDERIQTALFPGLTMDLGALWYEP
jgi:Uma2 family endonuclease